jgi:hypothetical protein
LASAFAETVFVDPAPVKVNEQVPPFSAMSRTSTTAKMSPEVASMPESETKILAVFLATVGLADGASVSAGDSLGLDEADGAAESLGETSVPQFG